MTLGVPVTAQATFRGKSGKQAEPRVSWYHANLRGVPVSEAPKIQRSTRQRDHHEPGVECARSSGQGIV